MPSLLLNLCVVVSSKEGQTRTSRALQEARMDKCRLEQESNRVIVFQKANHNQSGKT